MTMTNRVYGITGIEAIHSNFNADFDGEPKMVNGVLVASDVSFKYAYKSALNADGERILGINRVNDSGNIMMLKESYEYLFDSEIDKKTTENEVLQNLLTCNDIKMFGITFAVNSVNLGITGAIQIMKGVNVLANSEVYSETILSPYASEEGKKKSTIGNEIRVDKAHYLFNFNINPKQYEKYVDIGCEFKREDYELFKDYSLDSVTRLNSRTKVGCSNNFALFIEMKEDKCLTSNLRAYIDIEEGSPDDIVVYDLAKITKLIDSIKENVESVEVYYNPASIELKNIPEGKVYDIISRKEI